MTTLELLKLFLIAYFEEHNTEKGLTLVTEDVQCYGFADNQDLQGIEDLKKMSLSESYCRFMNAELKIEKGTVISEDNAVVHYSLSYNSTTISGRIAGNSRHTSEGNKLYFINNTPLSPSQNLHVFEDVARISRDEMAKELFLKSVPGGLMGGYIEQGFPFYFINDTMLNYLGYESEEDFIQSIDGMIENCFYGEDQDMVNQVVLEQIEIAGEYDVEYRMLKKDGNYIWIHDIGKKIVAEDGRNAIISVCYDITSEKEHEIFLKGVVNGFDGDMAIFAVDLEKGFLIPTYVSDNMGKHEGISKEEFLRRNTENSMNSIYSEDRNRAWNSVCDAVKKDITPSISFRVLDRNGKTQWVNASFSKYGERDGMPTILAFFADSTIQNDLQLHALNQNGTGITVIDSATHEVYFANDAIFNMLGVEPFDFTNKLCSDMGFICGGLCENCSVNDAINHKVLNKTVEFNGKWLQIHAEQREWADKLVVSIYATDATKQHILEQQIIEEDAQLQGILKNMACGISVSEYDKTGKSNIVYLSDVFLKMCEGDRATVIDTFEKEPFYGVVQEDIHIIQEVTERLLENGGTDDITYRFMTFAGNLVWIHAFYSVIVNSDGSGTMYFTCVDVTDKFELQKQLEDLVENMPSAVCLYRLEGKKIHRLMTGYGYEELCGKTAAKSVEDPHAAGEVIIHPDDLMGVQKFADSFLQDGKDKTGSHQYRIWNEEKQAYIWLTVHSKLVKQSDGTSLLYSVYTDETEQIELGERLADTRNAINAAVQYGQLGLWTYDLNSKTILQSLADEGSYGYDSKIQYTTEGFVSEKIVHEDDAEKYLNCYQAIHDGAKDSDCIARIFNNKSKEYRWMHIYLVRQPDGQHTNPKAIGMSFDIHQEIENYEELSKTQIQLKHEKHIIDDLFENLPGGVVMYHWDKKELLPLYVSKGFSDMYGENGEDVLIRGKDLYFDVVHPDDLPGLQSFILNHIEKTDNLITYRYRVWNRHQKDYIWIQLTGNVKLQPDGTSIAYANYANVDAEVKAANEIRREEELLEKTCQLAHIWMFHYNLKTKQIRLSKGLQEYYDLPAVIDNFPDDFLKYPTIPKEYHPLYRKMIQDVDAGKNAIAEMQIQNLDGTRRFIRFEWHVTMEEDGKVVEVAGLPIDITKEVAERRRIEKERQKLLGGDKKLTAYSITDLQNEKIVEAKGYYLCVDIHEGDTCQEFDEKVVPLLLTDQDRQRYFKMRDFKHAIHQYESGITQWTADMRWKNANGHIRWQRSVNSIIENSDTGALNLYWYLYDVMEEKVSQALFAGIQGDLYLKTGVLSFSTEQIYDYEGDFAERRLRITDYNVVRKEYISEYIFPEDEEMMLEQSKLENVKKQLNSEQKSFYFVHQTRKNGTVYYYQILYAMVPERNDVCISVVRDVTDLVMDGERKNAELQRALEVANAATQAKSEFLSRMSHEIRTPMNAIMGMTAIAQDNKSDFLQVSDCLSKIDSSSRYLLTLINDILEMSRIESGRINLTENKFDFETLIDQICFVAEPLASKSEIRLEITNHTSNGNYYGDYIRIQQVMVNLIGNAIKFTKKLGRVRFDISIAEDRQTETEFEFLVEDTGIGMSEEFMEHMFEPFSQEDSTNTSEYGGSGLGLAISKSLVEAMGGTIDVESIVDIGTNFIVRIPIKKADDTMLVKTETADEMSEEEIDSILKGKNILMAEDHQINVMVAKKLLEKKGVIVTIAENGKIALEIFRESKINEYDAILMDIRMPIMDGLEATKQIRALDREDATQIPVIAMTANALLEDRKNSKAAGMNEHLAKPIEPKKMYQTIAKQVTRRSV